MKVLSTEGLTKLIQLIKSGFISVDDTETTTEIDTVTTSELTLATVATSGSYNDLSNKPTIPSAVTESTVSGWGFTKNEGTVTSVNNVSPVNGNVSLTIPAAQVNSDWNATSGVAQILNKPTLATVATSGSYNDLNNTPDLTTKADIDLSNLNATGKSLASGLGLPSSRYTTLTLGASDTSYTAPANGWFSFTASSPNTSDHDGIYIMNTDAGIGMSTTQIWGRNMYVFAPALSGQKVKVSYVSSITNKTLKFIYAEGEN